jgi:LAGLIDADG DNA endonuclease family
LEKTLPPLPEDLKEICIAMVLSDATMYKVSKEALIKFEQGYKQEEFLRHLFILLKSYCFMVEPGFRYTLSGNRKGLIKSLWFKTFSHYSFTSIWNLFYVKSGDSFKKRIPESLVKEEISKRGLSFWIMADGSLQKDKKTMILHTQSYTKEENLILSKELNDKFNFHTIVIPHKRIY